MHSFISDKLFCFFKQLFHGYKIALICVIIVTSSTKTKFLFNNKSFSNYGEKNEITLPQLFNLFKMFRSLDSLKTKSLKISERVVTEWVLVSEWAFFFLIQSHTRCLHSHKLDTSRRLSLPGASESCETGDWRVPAVCKGQNNTDQNGKESKNYGFKFSKDGWMLYFLSRSGLKGISFWTRGKLHSFTGRESVFQRRDVVLIVGLFRSTLRSRS